MYSDSYTIWTNVELINLFGNPSKNRWRLTGRFSMCFPFAAQGSNRMLYVPILTGSSQSRRRAAMWCKSEGPSSMWSPAFRRSHARSLKSIGRVRARLRRLCCRRARTRILQASHSCCESHTGHLARHYPQPACS